MDALAKGPMSVAIAVESAVDTTDSVASALSCSNAGMSSYTRSFAAGVAVGSPSGA